MANLTFNSIAPSIWEATSEVNGDFNLHIEKTSGTVTVRQKTAGTLFADTAVLNSENVIDVDFVGNVYPKTIKVVVTGERPSVGIITESE